MVHTAQNNIGNPQIERNTQFTILQKNLKPKCDNLLYSKVTFLLLIAKLLDYSIGNDYK